MQILLELLKIIVCLAILAAVVNYVLTKGIPSSSRFRGRKRRH